MQKNEPFGKEDVLSKVFSGIRVRAVDWDESTYIEVANGQIVDNDGEGFDVTKAKEDQWVEWRPVEKSGAVISKEEALKALFGGKAVRAVDWDEDKKLFYKGGQILMSGNELFDITKAKEDQWIIIDESQIEGSNSAEIAELKEMIEQLLANQNTTQEPAKPKDGRDLEVQSTAAESLQALYGVTTPKEILAKFKDRLDESKSSRDIQKAVCEFIPFCWIGGKTMGTASTYYTKLRKVAKEIKNEGYREVALALCLPPQSLYDAVQGKVSESKKEKIRNDETFEIEHIEEIIARLREIIDGGDEAIKKEKTRQQTFERAKAYVYATYLALVTGRRMIEILKTLRIEKKGKEWYYCGIAKSRDEEDKCIKAYALDPDFVFLSELLQYVQSHIDETGGKDMTPTQINSKFNNPFNGAFKKLTGTSFTFKDARDIFVEMLWDQQGNEGSWVDERDFRAEVLGHEYDSSLSTPEHYMGLKGVRNEA